MIQPKALKPGDLVGISAPAGRVPEEEMAEAVKILEQWGLKVVLGDNLFNDYFNFSATDSERAADFQQMLDNPAIKAIFCARGGYGSTRIIDNLDFSKFYKMPKWIIGYSDITVFLSQLSCKGICSIHGTMPVKFNEYYLEELPLVNLKQALFGKSLNYTFPSHPLNQFGNMNAEVIGGNLSILCSLIGSETDINTSNKILFLEDIGEYLYRIDRLMLSLKRSGKLSNLNGLMVGGLSELKDNDVPFAQTAEEIILDKVKEYGYPVCFGFPAGHIHQNLPIIFGKMGEVKITADSTRFIQ